MPIISLYTSKTESSLRSRDGVCFCSFLDMTRYVEFQLMIFSETQHRVTQLYFVDVKISRIVFYFTKNFTVTKEIRKLSSKMRQKTLAKSQVVPSILQSIPNRHLHTEKIDKI